MMYIFIKFFCWLQTVSARYKSPFFSHYESFANDEPMTVIVSGCSSMQY